METDFVAPRPTRLPPYFPQPYSLPPPQAMAYRQLTPANHVPEVSPLSTSGSTSRPAPKNAVTRPTRPSYLPAVLRPNEYPSKAPIDDDDDDDDDGRSERFLGCSNASILSLPLGALSCLSRRSIGGDSVKAVDHDHWDLDLDLFPKPTGLPTREHWKPDPESTMCDHATCKRHFGYFTRRHHCRRCGNIFCGQHSALEVPLDQDANYNPRGTPSRSCAHCYTEFRQWRSRTNSQSSVDTAADDKAATALAPTPATWGVGAVSVPISPTLASPTKPPSAPELAVSAPSEWNWSTF